MSNRAAWIPSKQAHPFTVSPAPMPDPGTDLITIRVHAVAINPADHGIQALGIIVQDYPAILGCDAAGEVTAIGSSVTAFKVGDRVTGSCDHATDLVGQGTFQLYANLRPGLTGKVPEGVEFKDACVLPLGMNTACYGLFEKEGLGLQLPGTGRHGDGKVLLVWGGSSSVGSCAIQAAKAAGYKVAATASKQNLEYCKGIGADWAFDYKSELVVEDVVEGLKGCDFAGAFNSIMAPATYDTCAEIVHQLGGVQVVASIVPHIMPFKRDLPYGIRFGNNDSTHIKSSNVGPAIYGKWFPAALADGTLKCKPDPVVVGHGLESCQEAVDRMKGGASAQKFVVVIQ